MDKIEVLMEGIREKINATRKQNILLQDKKNRNKICACLDTIGDIQVAIHEYHKLPDDENSLYLPIYGLLQGLYLQTDAVGHLHQSIVGNCINFKVDYPEIYDVRELRNDIVGHPTSRRDKKTKQESSSFHVIGRITMSKKGFTAINYLEESAHEIKHVNLMQILEKQQNGVLQILQYIDKYLSDEEQNHKIKFIGKKLSDTIPTTFSYNISKLYEGIHRDYMIPKMNLESINDVYEKLKEEILERYNTLDFCEHELIKIKYIIDYLFHIFNGEITKNMLEMEIYIDVLKVEFNNLADIAKEIDDDFFIE